LNAGLSLGVVTLKEIIFFIGGCRSGKSRQALKAADDYPGDRRTFIATCIPRDDEMLRRVKQHQKERSRDWLTVEAPIDLPGVIVEQSRQADLLLVDCLTLWISNLMLESGDSGFKSDIIDDLVRSLGKADCPVVIVSNEVGTGIVPENKLARQYRDLVGSVNQAIARQANRVVWVVAGIPVTVKG
jgi:adenosylcobinamide kinase/adenosylcobinamide-phosphate guanylyltransferase